MDGGMEGNLGWAAAGSARLWSWRRRCKGEGERWAGQGLSRSPHPAWIFPSPASEEDETRSGSSPGRACDGEQKEEEEEKVFLLQQPLQGLTRTGKLGSALLGSALLCSALLPGG